MFKDSNVVILKASQIKYNIGDFSVIDHVV